MATLNTQIGTKGSDELTVSKKGFNYVMGLEGNDKYIINNIKNSWTIVDDGLENPISDAGEDTVQINNVYANDLILFFDVGITGDEANLDESLCVVHKSYINSVISQIKKI